MTAIYALADEAGAIRYIGLTDQPLMQRLYRHVSAAKCPRDRDTKAAKWIRSLFPARPTIHCLLQVEKHEAPEAEKVFIAAMLEGGVPLLNMTTGGCGTPGHRKGIPLSDEHRRKIGDKMRGVPLGPQSAEHRANLAAAKRGKPLSEAHKAKLRGRSWTAETNAKRSDTMKARLADPAVRAAMSERRRQENADPAMRARKSAACKAAWARRRA
jgi:hypothetical protein